MAVENKLIICPDEVDLREGNFFIPRDALKHFQSCALLAFAPGRRRKVQDDFRSLRDEFLYRVAAVNPLRPEILVIPDVLTNCDAELATVENKRLNFFGRLKITVLIKHIIGRQQAFDACAR